MKSNLPPCKWIPSRSDNGPVRLRVSEESLRSIIAHQDKMIASLERTRAAMSIAVVVLLFAVLIIADSKYGNDKLIAQMETAQSKLTQDNAELKIELTKLAEQNKK